MSTAPLHSALQSVLFSLIDARYWSDHLTTKGILLARAASVHDFSSVVSRELAESIVAVNDWPLHDLCVSQQETGFCKKIHQQSSSLKPNQSRRTTNLQYF